MIPLNNTLCLRFVFKFVFIFFCVLFFTTNSEAATLRLSPDTGVYVSGNTFTANVLINTQGKPINAADAQLSFNPKEITVVSVNRASSIFNLWTLEPTFSNSAGTISFGGGSPTGYTGSNGIIMSITFRAQGAGTPKVTFKSGSILAADGLGTNVLTSMNGGTYTIGAKTEEPAPEYVPPANTPSAPKVTSKTHSDETVWYKESVVQLEWSVPSDVTAVRTLLDSSKNTVPTILYEEPITSRELKDMPQGTSYFHIQFKNADGWGRVTHFAINIDSEEPKEFSISEKEPIDATSPERTLTFTIEDTSPITRYLIQIDGGEAFEYIDTKLEGEYKVPPSSPGHHTIVVEAFDSAGNSRIATYSYDISSFEPPTFTEYPERITSDVIPALRGTTRPDAHVGVTVRSGETEIGTYSVQSDANGSFTFIPANRLLVGVYDIVAIASNKEGAKSEPSTPIRLIVEEPGYVMLGSFMISLLSVLIPLLALILLLIFGMWYLFHRLSSWRRKITRETVEAEEKLRTEFELIVSNLHANVDALKESRKSKLTRAELALIDDIERDLKSAQAKIRKEISDIENIVQ